MSSEHFMGIYEMLRNGKPVGITFFRNGDGVLNNVWLGTSSRERMGEEESTRLRWPAIVVG